MRVLIFLKRILKSEEGFALPAALALLLVGGLLLVPSSMLTQTSLNSNRIIDDRDKSIYAADAGIEYALWQIQNNAGLHLPSLHQQISVPFVETINGKTLAITIYNQDGKTFRINSVSSDGVGLSVGIISDVDLTFTGGTSSSLFDYALASLNGNISLSGNTDVESDEVQQGDIYANGNVSLSGNAKVNGDAGATGTISTLNNATIAGQRTEGAPPLPIPAVDTASYENETLASACVAVTHPTGWTISGTGNYEHTSPVHVTGNLSITRSGTVTFTNNVCVDGNLSIGANTSVVFQGPVKVTGTISISSNITITFGSTVHVDGSFTTSGNAVMNVGGTLYVKGGIALSGNSNGFTGGHTVIAEGNITMSGNSTVYPAAENIPFVMSKNGTMTLSGNNWTAAILYAPNGSITLSGNSKLYGSAVGQSIAGSGNSKITYPIDLRNREDLPGTQTSGTVLSGMTIRTYSIQ
jgi:hypothetical protein